MKKLTKRILGIVLSSIGLVEFIMLYVLVVISQADFIKYIVTVLGYCSVVFFIGGIFLIKTSMNNNENKEQKKEN